MLRQSRTFLDAEEHRSKYARCMIIHLFAEIRITREFHMSTSLKGTIDLEGRQGEKILEVR